MGISVSFYAFLFYFKNKLNFIGDYYIGKYPIKTSKQNILIIEKMVWKAHLW